MQKQKRKVGRACNACRKAHLRCDMKRPCERCVKKGLECQDVAKDGTILFSAPPTTPSTPVTFIKPPSAPKTRKSRKNDKNDKNESKNETSVTPSSSSASVTPTTTSKTSSSSTTKIVEKQIVIPTKPTTSNTIIPTITKTNIAPEFVLIQDKFAYDLSKFKRLLEEKTKQLKEESPSNFDDNFNIIENKRKSPSTNTTTTLEENKKQKT